MFSASSMMSDMRWWIILNYYLINFYIFYYLFDIYNEPARNSASFNILIFGVGIIFLVVF